jgi:biopolymer transport protein ExbB
MREFFLKGGVFMWPLLIVAVIGVAIAIERLIWLTIAKRRTRKFVANVVQTLKTSGVDAAIERCQKTRGPVAAIFAAGLMRYERGIESVQKAIEDAGSIEMSLLEKRLVWLATVANIAPMLGFLGTVSGMINAFDTIAKMGEIEPSAVASGISEALITTASGLSIAIPIQFFYNLFITMVNRIVLDMEESSSELVDLLSAMEHAKEEK